MNIELQTILNQAIAEKVFPGAVVGVVTKDGIKDFVVSGHLTYDQESAKVTEHTMYDLASVTKAIPGSGVVMKLIDDDHLKLEDTVATFLPEFATTKFKEMVTIKHLLTYTLDIDLPSMAALKDKTADQLISIVLAAPLKTKPGSTYKYTNATALLMSLVVEKVTGQSLDIVANDYFFKPLGMNETSFLPNQLGLHIAPTEFDDWRGRLIVGEVHDESAWIIRQKHVTAAAGLFSTAHNITTYIEMLLNDGVKDGHRYFSHEMITAMHTNQLDVKNTKAGLGWEMDWPDVFSSRVNERVFFKTGFTGTLVAVDPLKGIGFVLLSNRIYPKRSNNNGAINEVRRKVAGLIFSE